MEGNYFVYILRNKSKKRYIGISSDLQKRLKQHNEDFSRFTKNRGPWGIEWSSKALSHQDALKLEKLLKKQKGGMGLSTLMRIHS